MIPDIAGTLLMVVSPLLPIFPSLPVAANLVGSNNTAGSGTYSMAFNTTSKTATFSSSSSLGSPQSFTVTYFGAGTVDASEYEIRAEIAAGPTTGSNIALAGGSAALNTWITLSASPSFNFTASGRRSGLLSLSITIRHKIQTTYSSTRVYGLQQQSDAVVPGFGGGFGNQITLSVFPGETFNMGFYIDNASAANNWMLRTYRNGTYIQGLTGDVSFGGISESEYDITIVSAATSAAMPFLWGSSVYGNAGDRRSFTASATSGPYYGGDGSTGAGSALLVIRFKHVTDQNVFSDLVLTFNKTS